MVLDLEIKATLSENFLEAAGLGRGAVFLAFAEKISDRAIEPRTEADQAIAVLGKKLQVNPWLVMKSVGESLGGDVNKILITLEVFGEKH